MVDIYIYIYIRKKNIIFARITAHRITVNTSYCKYNSIYF